jgi:hypothetical protein
VEAEEPCEAEVARLDAASPADSFSYDLSALRALGADDVKPTRTPALWMILLVAGTHAPRGE